MTDETITLAIGQPEATTEASATPATTEEPIDLDAVSTAATGEVDASLTGEGAEHTDELENAENDPFAGYEDFEFDGKSYKIPTELKDGYLRQADYSRKTQEVAAKNRELQAREQEVQRQGQLSDEEFNAKVAIQVISRELEAFKDANWQELNSINPQEDPVAFMEAQQKWQRFQHLKDIAGQASQVLQSAAQQRTQAAEQDIANRLRATAEFAKREIKGWTPEIDNKVTQFAEETLGYDRDTLKQAYTPQVYKTLYLAWLGQQSLTRQQSAKPTPIPVAQTQTVSAKGNAVVQKAPEDMSMSEYAEYRQAQAGRK
jgi:hypothetical protein